MEFEFATATRIIFGKGSAKKLAEQVKYAGKHPLFLLGPQKVGANLIDSLTQIDGAEVVVVPGEPTLPFLLETIAFAKAKKCDFVVSIGGGSVIDSGKALSALLVNPGDIMDYLEVVGKALPLKQKGVPFFALPTTAGTGAEVTRNAVIDVPEKSVKVSLRSPYLYPDLAMIDPELTYSVPPTVTASTGMDAFTQVLEPYVSIKANFMTDVFCREGLTRIGRSLVKAYQNGADEAAREDMAWGSLLGGLSLANAGLGAVHGFAGPIGGMFHAPHGAICAALLAPVTEMNIKVLKEKHPQHPAINRYREISKWITGKDQGDEKLLVDTLREVTRQLNILPLSAYDIDAKDIPLIVEKSQVASSMKGNPIVLDKEALAEIIQSAL